MEAEEGHSSPMEYGSGLYPFNYSVVWCHWLWKNSYLESPLTKESSTGPSKWIWFIIDPFSLGNLSSVPEEKGSYPQRMPPKFAVIQRLELGSNSITSKDQGWAKPPDHSD